MRRLLVFGIPVLVVLALAGGIVFLISPTPWKVTRAQLRDSVESEVGGGSALEGSQSSCKRSAGAWRCYVEDTAGSGGGAEYRVRLDGSCWHAWKTVRETDGEPLAERAESCVSALDQLR